MLMFRPIGGGVSESGVVKHFEVLSGDFLLGRIYEEANAPKHLRWYWNINGIQATRFITRTEGQAATFDTAKAELIQNWQKWLACAKLRELE